MLIDGHCHPTDDIDSLKSIAHLECRMAIMSTRLDDLDLVAQQAALHPKKVIPAFGIHPWFSHLLTLDESKSKNEHYRSILRPDIESDDPLLQLLPEPVSADAHFSRVRSLLENHPHALLGEVGLDAAFRLRVGGKLTQYRVKLNHQREVLRRQLEIAAHLHRPISLHGVKAPQALFDDVAAFDQDPTKGLKLGNICLHSYGGSAEFYQSHWSTRLHSKVYISVATLINGKMHKDKLHAMLAGSTVDRVLSESDYNSAGDIQLDLVRQSAALFAQHFHLTEEEIEAQIESNFNEFVREF